MAPVEEGWRREGRFWLPDSENKVFGWIDYKPERGITVHLLESPFEESVVDVHRVEVLHGESLDHWPFTLLDGERVGPRTITLSNAHTADLYFEVLVHGPHVTRLTEVSGTRVHVGLRGLRDLVTGSGFGTPLLRVSADEECVEHRSVTMGWGELQLFAAGQQTKWSREETQIKVVAHVQMAFVEEVDIGVVDAAVEPLRDFIVFSTSRPSYVTGLSVYGGAPHSQGDSQHRPEFRVIRPPDDGRAERNRGRLPLLLNPATVPGSADIFATWAALREKLGAVWRLFFSTLVDPWLTPESQLLNLTAFAEGYHRTLHDSPPLTAPAAATAVRQMLDVLPDRQHRDVFPAL